MTSSTTLRKWEDRSGGRVLFSPFGVLCLKWDFGNSNIRVTLCRGEGLDIVTSSNQDWIEQGKISPGLNSSRLDVVNTFGSKDRIIAPIVIHFDVTRKKKRGLFQFDRRLKDKPEIRQIVSDQWKESSIDSVLSKISWIRASIIRYMREQNLNSNLAIQKNQEELEKALSSLSPDTEIIASLTAALESAYKEEELYWRQWSRINGSTVETGTPASFVLLQGDGKP